MLTAKQEKYVQGLIKGLSQRQAYKEAYDTENMADSSIDTEAWKLLRHPLITQRYQELLQATVDETILSVKEKRQMYKRFAQDEKLSMSDRLKAMEQDSKLGGEYVQKIDATVETTTINISLDEE